MVIHGDSPLFRLGHFPVRKLLVYQRASRRTRVQSQSPRRDHQNEHQLKPRNGQRGNYLVGGDWNMNFILGKYRNIWCIYEYMTFMTFHSGGNFIIPTDELTPWFFRGVGQPPTSYDQLDLGGTHGYPIFENVLVYIWVNYNDLTATSLEIMVSKGNHPQMVLIQVSEIL